MGQSGASTGKVAAKQPVPVKTHQMSTMKGMHMGDFSAAQDQEWKAFANGSQGKVAGKQPVPVKTHAATMTTKQEAAFDAMEQNERNRLTPQQEVEELNERNKLTPQQEAKWD